MKEINLEHLQDLALGAAFLGTGGGGDPYDYQLALEIAIPEKGPVQLVAPADLAEDATVMSMGGVGAPMIASEKLPNGMEGVDAIEKLSAYAGVTCDALIAAEIGGGNGLVPMLTGLHMGLPIVDGDGMGRAYPETQMETFSIYGISATPLAAVDEYGNCAIVTARDSHTAERIVRQVGLSMGGHCMCADHLMTGKDVQNFAIHGTVGLSVELGKIIRDSTGLEEFLSRISPELEKCGYGSARCIFEGKVTDVKREMIGGYDVGHFVIRTFDDATEMSIRVQNEYLIATIDDRAVATVPDLICIIDRETLLPITSERLRYGLRVAVIGIPCCDLYRSTEAMAVTAPRAFGFDIDYVEMT